MVQTLLYTVGFVVICLASHRIGQFFSWIRLPYITGYLFAGALVASFGLDFIPSGAAQDLRFIDELSLAVIAFVAGSELYLKDLRSRLGSILWTTGGILVVALLLGGVAIYVLTEFIPFTRGMEPASRLAVALLGSTVLLALSPPSTIAVIKEARARGPFTSTTLGVTVLMDVAIIVLFAVSASVASALLLDVSFSIGFVGVLVLDLTLAIGIGLIVGKLLQALLAARWHIWLKQGLVVLIGWSIFLLAGQVKQFSAAQLPFEIYIEPLLIALVAGFLVANYTAHRAQFDDLLHAIGPAVYVAFFTLTGISLKLDILITVLPVAGALFVVRGLGIFIGSFAGGALAGVSPQHRRISWMAFITQAGIALGLAREVAVQFPALGDAFATLIISVVVLNEIFGPLFLKAALKRVGETNLPEDGTPDEVRDVLILGIESQSIALARQLQEEGWQVALADPDPAQIKRLEGSGLTGHVLDEDDPNALSQLLSGDTDSLVAMLRSDEANLEACTQAFERYGVDRMVVRLQDMKNMGPFREMGVLVVDATSALVSLIDQAVRAPQTAALLLHQGDDREVIQITLSHEEMSGVEVRDLRLPGDVLLLGIRRNRASLVPHGTTVLKLRDEITLLGSRESLDAVTLRLGY
ncbi:MAG: cation:proton antiporter [Rhodothermales bacterium]|nr:cation:proton antiporter [Rhodothermales bacterium]MBO6778648.1 cation:proton antiporter [Rhodothermales bacterium]